MTKLASRLSCFMHCFAPICGFYMVTWPSFACFPYDEYDDTPPSFRTIMPPPSDLFYTHTTPSQRPPLLHTHLRITGQAHGRL